MSLVSVTIGITPNRRGNKEFSPPSQFYSNATEFDFVALCGNKVFQSLEINDIHVLVYLLSYYSIALPRHSNGWRA